MKFVKMHGTGNDFVIIDDRNNNFLNKESSVAKVICDRHFGIGADGILLVRNTETADIEMVIINADGSYAAMCGNGIRCFAKYVYDEKVIVKEEIKIKTGDGIKVAQIEAASGVTQKVRIDMGLPSFRPSDIPAKVDSEIINYDVKIGKVEYRLNSMLMGVPHTVIIGELDKFKVEEGKNIEKYNMLFPQGTNVNFCEIINQENIKVKTWERGAGATLACGTGCCAAVIASNKLGYTGKNVDVLVPGGKVHIDISDEGVFMTGDAVVTFKGETELI